MKRIIYLSLLIVGALFLGVCCSGPSEPLTEEHYVEFGRLLSDGDFEAAQSKLLEWEKQYPNDAQVIVFRSLYHYKVSATEPSMASADSALLVLSKGIEKYPDRLDLRLLKAEMHLGWEEPYQASQEMISALKRSVENDNKWYGDFGKPIETDGVSYLRFYIQEYVAYLLEYEDLTPVENLISYSIGLYPEDPVFMSNLGEFNAHKGDYESALLAYQVAYEMDPDDAIITFNLGNIYWTLDDIPNAVKYYGMVARSDDAALSDLARQCLQEFSPGSVEMRKSFLGLELGKAYDADLDVLKEELRAHSDVINVDAEKNEITARNVAFMDVVWDIVIYSFSDDTPKVLSDIIFISEGYQEKDGAMAVVEYLSSKHAQMYGDPSSETVDDNGLRAVWNLEDDAYGCSVATIPLQSDGVTAWCAGLIYAMTVENNF
jgi:tetratricopeptide (TPR) repeat protein